MVNNILSQEHVDYLEEMMNIGAGNAATALEQLLTGKFEMCMPAIHVILPHEAFSVIGDPAEAVTCVRMKMVGQCRGEIFFVVPLKKQKRLVKLACSSVGLNIRQKNINDVAVIEEIGNILAGVYLTSIHDFCGLDIFHTVPDAATDMLQAVLDETIARMSGQNERLIIILNKFLEAGNKEEIDTYLVLIPAVDSLKTLTDSIEEAKRIIHG